MRVAAGLCTINMSHFTIIPFLLRSVHGFVPFHFRSVSFFTPSVWNETLTLAPSNDKLFIDTYSN